MNPAIKPGLLLFAHGARDPRWAEPFRRIEARIKVCEPGLAVELAFLEFMAPDLMTAGARLAEAGCTQVDVLPLFLGTGGHVRKDLPALLGSLAVARSQVRWTLRAAVGEIDSVVEAMALAALASMKQSAP
ncbi:MAG: CbiX/SirB N-terminal domain-containing protein [Burkholderiaceae bacterium]